MSRAAARMRSPTRDPARPHDLPGFPSGQEHYQKELAELVASTTGPLDAPIAELRARYDIEQAHPPGDPRAPVNTPARLSLTPRLGDGHRKLYAPSSTEQGCSAPPDERS